MSIRVQLDTLFSKENSGGMRVFLFAKFYEELLREYLSRKGYEVCSGKPRIYWNRITLPKEQATENYARLINSLKQKQSSGVYCIPDGLLVRWGQYIVWEAKNWVQELFYSPFADRVWRFSWLLAKQVEYQGQSHPISGFLISWWEREEGVDETVTELRQCISPLGLDIIFTKDVLHECITAQYDWYLELVKEKQRNISQFFGILLGEANGE